VIRAGKGAVEVEQSASSAEELFQAVVRHHDLPSGEPLKRGFGSDALKVNGKIFAALSKGRLLLKLPSARVDALVTANLAERFSTGAGRPKREWVTVAPSTAPNWIGLSDEARQYVSSQSR
jgi:hypothetical protein